MCVTLHSCSSIGPATPVTTYSDGQIPSKTAPSLLFLGQTQPGISAMKRTLQVMMVSSTSFLHQSQTLVHVTGVFRMLLSQLCLCPPPVSLLALDRFLGASSWPVKDRGACSLSHLHPWQTVVLTEHCLGTPFFPVLQQKCLLSPLTSVSLKTGKSCFQGGDNKVNCRESCSLRVCSVVLLAAGKIYC